MEAKEKVKNVRRLNKMAVRGQKMERREGKTWTERKERERSLFGGRKVMNNGAAIKLRAEKNLVKDPMMILQAAKRAWSRNDRR